MTTRDEIRFDPGSILASLQSNAVAYAMIGGLARVLRGADEVTSGVDICPSLLPDNLVRLEKALAEMHAARLDDEELALDAESLQAVPVMELATAFGELKVVATPAGVPRGFEALRPGATSEHLGKGLRPAIASTADLVAMSAALRRTEDLERLPALRRILELEADPAALVAGAPPRPQRPRLGPGDAEKVSRSYVDRRRLGHEPGPGPDRGR